MTSTENTQERRSADLVNRSDPLLPDSTNEDNSNSQEIEAIIIQPVSNLSRELPDSDDEEETKRKKRDEACCCYAGDLDVLDIYILCRCIGQCFVGIGECTESCCEGCAECIVSCCESQDTTTESVDCGGCDCNCFD